MSAPDGSPATPRPALLLLAAAAGALCGIVYELLLASLGSYLLGNAVLVFSLTVGGFLASMGLGAFLSRWLRHRLLSTFLRVELALAVAGGILPLGLYAIYASDGPYALAQAAATALVGALVGLELPLLTRMLEETDGLRVAIARALALDYLGALLGSVLFPLVLLPWVGLVGSAALAGAAGAAVTGVVAWGHRASLPGARRLGLVGFALAAVLAAAAVPARRASNWLEDRLYQAPVIARVQSPHQRIILTQQRDDLRLFLDGDLQFSALDEYRYHEALVHPALSLHPRPGRVLLLGAGDGLAARELLRYPELRELVLVELDPVMIDLARRHPALRRLNAASLDDPRVQVMIADAFTAVTEGRPPLDRPFDVVVADFPDPDTEAVARLYSTAFYRSLAARLAPGGLLVTQSSSPFYAPDAFRCVARTLEEAGFGVRSYVTDIPSFGPWGYHLAGPGAAPAIDGLHLRVPTRFLTDAFARAMFELPRDLAGRAQVRANRLLDPVLVRYHNDPRWAAYR